MTPAAPIFRRRSFLPYAIGFDLALIAVGASLLLPTRSGAILLPFLGAVALAAWRGGWRVGLATTAFSLLAIVITFGANVPTGQLLLFVLSGIAASALLDATRGGAEPATSDSAAAESEPGDLQTLAHSRRAVEFRRRALPLVMYAGLPALVLIVYLNLSYILIENFSIPSVLQPFILVLAGLILHFRDSLRPETVVLQAPALALIGYCLVVFASSSWARDAAVADLELTDLIKSLMLLIVAASLAASWRALRGALIALVAAAVFLSLIALVQVGLGDPSRQFGGLSEIEEGHLFGDRSELRPGGPVGDPNYFARILILAFPAAAFLGVGRRSRTEQATYLAGAAVIGLAILFTYSRGGMLSLAAVCLLLLILRRVRITRVTVLIAVVLLAALMPTNVGQRLLTIETLISTGSADGANDSSMDKRKQLLAVAWRMFNDHPLAGVGVGNFGSHYGTYANQVGFAGPDYTPLGVRQYAHNLYLEAAVETGLLGLLALGAAMAVALAALYRARRTLLGRGETAHAAMVTAVAIAIIGYLLSSAFLHHSGVHRYLWLILGLGVAAVRLTGNAGDAFEDRREFSVVPDRG